jgi:hypothetical protein
MADDRRRAGRKWVALEMTDLDNTVSGCRPFSKDHGGGVLE